MLVTIMADPIAVFACSHRMARAGWRPCDESRPRTLFLDLSSAGSITSTTHGSPETERRSTVPGRRGTRDSYVRCLLPRVRTPDSGALRPKSGAAQLPPRPILAAVPGVRGPRPELLRRTSDHIEDATARSGRERTASMIPRWPTIVVQTPDPTGRHQTTLAPS